MDATQALEILKQYKAWKADPTAHSMPDPAQLGQAIDVAADAVPSAHHAEILGQYNAWRRDDTGREVYPGAFSIRAAIDHAITMWGG